MKQEEPKKKKEKKIKKTILQKYNDLYFRLLGKQVNKSGFNDYNKYWYSTKEDIIKMFAKEVKDSGLSFTLHTKESKIEWKDDQRSVHIKGCMRISDGESDQALDIPIDGYAEDKGDKAMWKALTGMQKYFWLKTFNLQDNDLNDEPENNVEKGKISVEAKLWNFVSMITYHLNDPENNRLPRFDKAKEVFSGTQYEKFIDMIANNFNKK